MGKQWLKRNTQGTQAKEESLGAVAPRVKELAGLNLQCVLTDSLQRWLSRAGLKVWLREADHIHRRL